MGEHWIKLHRKMLEWEWFTDSTTLKLFIFMLFQANYKEYRHMGNVYPKGSFICQREHLETCGLTTKQVRHSLEKLKGTGEITTKTLGHATLFTITNWSKYQVTDGPNRNDTQNADFQHDTFKAPYDDGQTDGYTEDGENIGWPNKNHTQDTQFQHDTRDTNVIHGHSDGQRDGHSDGHSDGQTKNIYNSNRNIYIEGIESQEARARAREDVPSEWTKLANDLWNAYPRKQDMIPSLSAVIRAIEREGDFGTFKALATTAVAKFAEITAKWKQADRRYIPKMSTFFDNASYRDDPSSWERNDKPSHGGYDFTGMKPVTQEELDGTTEVF